MRNVFAVNPKGMGDTLPKAFLLGFGIFANVDLKAELGKRLVNILNEQRQNWNNRN